MPDISLLPEEMRKKQEQRKKSAPGNGGVGNAFYVPRPEVPPSPEATSPKPEAVISKPTEKPAPFASPVAEERHSIAPFAPVLERPPAPSRGNGKTNGAAKKTNGKNGHIEEKNGHIAAKSSLHVPAEMTSGLSRRISLIPEDLRAGARAGWERGVFSVSIVFALAIVAGAWYLLRARIDALEPTVIVVEQQYEASRERAAKAMENLKRYETTARRATAVRTLLAAHRDWSAFFRILEAQTLPNATYQTLTVDANGSVAVSVGVPSVRSATEQIVAWSSAPHVLGVENSGLSTTVDEVGVVRGVRFDLRLKVSPDAFKSGIVNNE